MTTATSKARFDARLPRGVRELFDRAAELEGVNVTDFVISAAKMAAELSIEKSSILRLSIQDSALFAKVMIGPPPEPTDALKRAFKRHRQLLGTKV